MENRFYVYFAILLFLFLYFLPNLYLYATSPSDKIFVGLTLLPADHASYYMWSIQYMDSFFAKNLYNLDSELKFFNLYFFIFGQFLVLGIDYLIIDIFFRIVLFILYIYFLDQFLTYYLELSEKGPLLIFIVFFVGILGFIVLETNIFSMFLSTPLNSIHAVLQLALFNLLLNKHAKNFYLILFMLLILLFSIHPYSILYIPFILISFSFFTKFHFKEIFLITIFTISLVLAFFFISNGFEQNKWLDYRYDYFKPIIFISLLPFSILFFIGLAYYIKNYSVEWTLIICWCSSIFVYLIFEFLFSAFHLPFQIQKVFINFSIPLVLLSLKNPFFSSFIKTKSYIPFLCVFLIFCMFNYFVLFGSLNSLVPYLYLDHDLIHLSEQIKLDGDIDTVVSDKLSSLFIPIFSRKSSLPGYVYFTPEYETKLNKSDTILSFSNSSKLENICFENPKLAIVVHKKYNLYRALYNEPNIILYGDYVLKKCRS